MARIGNFDVTYNRQGWFDTTLANPLEGWFSDDAIGAPQAEAQVKHGGFVSRAPRPTDARPTVLEEWVAEQERLAAANDNATDVFAVEPKLHVLDRFGPISALPEKEFLVAGNVEEAKTNWLLVGAAVAVGVGVGMALAKKSGKVPARRKAR